MEGWHEAAYREVGIGFGFVQWNVSRSAHGVLRGLHHQWPNPQGKLVCVLEGAVQDVAVDIRIGSPTYGQWWAVELSVENAHQLWVPPGFAHGFEVLSDHATFAYLCTALYDPAADHSIAWDDPSIGVKWHTQTPELSKKDLAAPRLQDIAPANLPKYGE